MNQIVDIFKKIGFQVVTNREIEDEWHNFTALNTPEDHPARDMTDTYYLKNDVTHMFEVPNLDGASTRDGIAETSYKDHISWARVPQ